MKKKDERTKKLIEILRVRGHVSIKELALMLNISEMTIRRDLKFLKENNVAENVDGILVYNPAHSDFIYSLSDEMEKRRQQKESIGLYAASLVELNDIIIVDTGTTTERIISNLPIESNLTVLCYNINILMELRRNPGVKMIFAGGYYHPNTQMFTCEEGIQFIQRIRAHKVFLSAAGIHPQLGITCANSYEVATKNAIMASSLRKILVTDSGKFNAVHSSYFCELKDIDDIVTDRELSDDWRQLITSLGIQLHLV